MEQPLLMSLQEYQRKGILVDSSGIKKTSQTHEKININKREQVTPVIVDLCGINKKYQRIPCQGHEKRNKVKKIKIKDI